jgi:hypothetical protein
MLPLLWMLKKPRERSCAKIAAALKLPPKSGKMTVYRHSRGLSPIPDDLKLAWVRLTNGQVRLEDVVNVPEGGG